MGNKVSAFFSKKEIDATPEFLFVMTLVNLKRKEKCTLMTTVILRERRVIQVFEN
jgi:hypothetical protein